MNEKLVEELSSSYSFDMAERMDISEGELANLRLGRDAKRIDVSNIKELIRDMEALGLVKSITRNMYAIGIQDGVLSNQYLNGYKEIDVSSEAGLILNPGKLDNRIFFRRWRQGFYLNHKRDKDTLRSLQFFDVDGTSINKIYLTPESNIEAFDSLVEKYMHHDQSPEPFTVKEKKSTTSESSPFTFDKAIDDDWRNMSDVHDFYLLMRKYRKSRTQLFRSVEKDLAYQVKNSSLLDVLEKAKGAGEELTIFISNAGCVQIYTGSIGKVFHKHGWLNVFNHDNKMHINDSSIVESWVVKKPCDTGYVTSLEVYAGDGEQVLQVYGKRVEGELEKDTWRSIVTGLDCA